MMSNSQKVVPYIVSLTWKYLQNNGDSSFQNYAHFVWLEWQHTRELIDGAEF